MSVAVDSEQGRARTRETRAAAFAYAPAGAPRAPALTIVTEVETGNDDELARTARSLRSQSVQSWRWTLVAAEGIEPPVDDPRVHLCTSRVRARRMREAGDGAAGPVALIDAGTTLEPTTLEKWAWYLDCHPDADAVVGAGELRPDSPVLLARHFVERAGGLDAARGSLHAGEVGQVSGTGSETRAVPFSPGDWHADTSPYPLLRQGPPFENALEKTGSRLLLLTSFMALGGADRVNLDVLRALRTHGWELTVASSVPGDHSLLPRFAEQTPDLFPLGQFLPVADWPRFLTYLIGSRRPDVVLISNSEVGYRLLPYLRSRCPAPAYVDLCHSEAEHWNNGGYPRLSVLHQDVLDLTLTASAHLRDWMGARGADTSRIEVCHANVDVTRFRPDPVARTHVRERLAISPEECVALFVGRVSEDKQPHVLGAAARRLRDGGCSFRLLVAGDGPHLAWLARYVRRHRLSRHVLLLGAISHEEMPELYQAADVLFLPSRSEGIALTVYEAMAAGIAVVVADVGGHAELVTPETGILVRRGTPAGETRRYAEALELLFANPERRAHMGAAARRRVESEFRAEAMEERLRALLELAQERRRAAPRPPVPPGVALAIATDAVELARTEAAAARARAYEATRGAFPSGVKYRAYHVLQAAGAPAYCSAVRRFPGLAAARDGLRQLMLGY